MLRPSADPNLTFLDRFRLNREFQGKVPPPQRLYWALFLSQFLYPQASKAIFTSRLPPPFQLVRA